MVIPRHRQHAALGEHAREIGVFEGIAGAIDAGGLAVPHTEHAIVESAGEQIGLLAAPDGGGGEVFVEALFEHHLGGLQVFGGARGLLVEAPQRRAPIAADEAGCMQPSRLIQPVLVHQHTQKRLDPGDEHPTVCEQKFVVERHILVPHRNIFPFEPLPRFRKIIYDRRNCLPKACP